MASPPARRRVATTSERTRKQRAEPTQSARYLSGATRRVTEGGSLSRQGVSTPCDADCLGNAKWRAPDERGPAANAQRRVDTLYPSPAAFRSHRGKRAARRPSSLQCPSPAHLPPSPVNPPTPFRMESHDASSPRQTSACHISSNASQSLLAARNSPNIIFHYTHTTPVHQRRKHSCSKA